MRWPAAVVLVLAACDPVSHVSADRHAAKDAVVQVADIRPDVRGILVVGDSEACAVETAVRARTNQTSETMFDCKVSSTISYWSERINVTLRDHPHPSTVVVFLGTNHYWLTKDLPDVGPIIDPIKATGATCVWVGNTAVRGRTWPVNRLLKDAVGPRCSYFDTEAAKIPLRDGIHPTPAGATKWVDMLWPLVE